jgi:hypothetical protein
LALARFQPNSVHDATDDARLSRVVRAEFAQLAPDRTASVATNPTAGGAKVNILVTGVTYRASSLTETDIGSQGLATIEALLQKRNPSLGDDPHLGWETISTTRLVQDPQNLGVWKGEVDVNEPLTPGNFRVLLLEYEWHRSDYQPDAGQLNVFAVVTGVTASARMVYADAFLLA